MKKEFIFLAGLLIIIATIFILLNDSTSNKITASTVKTQRIPIELVIELDNYDIEIDHTDLDIENLERILSFSGVISYDNTFRIEGTNNKINDDSTITLDKETKILLDSAKIKFRIEDFDFKTSESKGLVKINDNEIEIKPRPLELSSFSGNLILENNKLIFKGFVSNFKYKNDYVEVSL